MFLLFHLKKFHRWKVNKMKSVTFAISSNIKDIFEETIFINKPNVIHFHRLSSE